MGLLSKCTNTKRRARSADRPCIDRLLLEPVESSLISPANQFVWKVYSTSDACQKAFLFQLSSAGRLKVHNGTQKAWDALNVHDSVAILTVNATRKQFVFVRQFRPAVYINCVSTQEDENGTMRVDTDKYPGSLGLCLELCAGLMDKNHSAQETAQMELMEECGYKVPLDSLQRITSFRSGVGTSGSQQVLFYAEVTDAMLVGKGGGLEEEGEMIEVVHMPIEEGRKLIFDETVNRPGGLLFALQWFFATKWQKFVSQ